MPFVVVEEDGKFGEKGRACAENRGECWLIFIKSLLFFING